MATTFKRLSKAFVKPQREDNDSNSSPGPSSIDLLGIDVLTNHMHVKSVYFFPATLNAAMLREAYGKVLAAHPVMGGRVRTERGGKRVYVDWSKELGAPLYEQRALVYGGEGEESIAQAMKKHGHSFARGPMNHAVDDDRAALVVLTLTEIEYRETANPWSCRPMACQQQGFSSYGNCFEVDGGDKQQSAETQQEGEEDASELVARYAVGLAISHDVADGCTIAQFLMSLAHASMRKPIPRSVHDRSLLLSELPDPSTLPVGVADMFPGYRIVGMIEKALLTTSMIWGSMGVDCVRLSFPKKELDCIKAAAMGPLQGTEEWVSSSNALAAHLWPIISEVMSDGTQSGQLYPYHTAINHRRALNLPAEYFGNCATFRSAEPATSDEGLTALALKIRRASMVSGDQLDVKTELAWLQGMLEKGQIHKIMFSSMLDAFQGKPFFGWDDVSGFVPPKVPGVVLCGVPSVRIDLPMWPIPGIALVLPSVSPDGSVGKDVLMGMKKSSVAMCMSPEYQARIHAYAPARQASRSEAAETEAAPRQPVEETKESQ